jgi:hypothetical protein
MGEDILRRYRIGMTVAQAGLPHRFNSRIEASMNTPTHPTITFIGGGNMASAIAGGLMRQGHPAGALQIVEPWE